MQMPFDCAQGDNQTIKIALRQAQDDEQTLQLLCQTMQMPFDCAQGDNQTMQITFQMMQMDYQTMVFEKVMVIVDYYLLFYQFYNVDIEDD